MGLLGEDFLLKPIPGQYPRCIGKPSISFGEILLLSERPGLQGLLMEAPVYHY
jgi:hypothetical protein